MLLRWLAVLAICLSFASPRSAEAQTAPFCAPGETPSFSGGLGNLASQLGGVMGQAVECEHLDPQSGDTLQATTTGLGYQRGAAGQTPIFTDGASHVALTAGGLTGWDGPSVDGPLWLSLNATLPTWCSWLLLGQQVSGFLCAYSTGAVAAWSPPVDASNRWLLLGIEPSAGAEWQLTAVGQVILRRAPAIDPAAPPDSYLQVSVDPINGQPPPLFGTITGRVCNDSTEWTATDVQLQFVFVDSASLQTPDRATATLLAVPPNICTPFVASFSAAFAWQTVKLDRTTVSWRR